MYEVKTHSFFTDNVRVLGNTTAKFGNVSEKSCLNLCTNNRDNRGRSVNNFKKCIPFEANHYVKIGLLWLRHV